MADPFDNDIPLSLDGIIEMHKRRYSDPPYGTDVCLCRDCGSLVKHGWLSMHDAMHEAVRYPIYEDEESRVKRHEMKMILRDEEMDRPHFVTIVRDKMRHQFLREISKGQLIRNIRWTIILEGETDE